MNASRDGQRQGFRETYQAWHPILRICREVHGRDPLIIIDRPRWPGSHDDMRSTTSPLELRTAVLSTSVGSIHHEAGLYTGGRFLDCGGSSARHTRRKCADLHASCLSIASGANTGWQEGQTLPTGSSMLRHLAARSRPEQYEESVPRLEVSVPTAKCVQPLTCWNGILCHPHSSGNWPHGRRNTPARPTSIVRQWWARIARGTADFNARFRSAHERLS